MASGIRLNPILSTSPLRALLLEFGVEGRHAMCIPDAPPSPRQKTSSQQTVFLRAAQENYFLSEYFAGDAQPGHISGTPRHMKTMQSKRCKKHGDRNRQGFASTEFSRLVSTHQQCDRRPLPCRSVSVLFVSLFQPLHIGGNEPDLKFSYHGDARRDWATRVGPICC